MKHIQLQNCPRTSKGFKGAAFRVLVCLMMFVSFSAYAQKNNVSGVVVDKNTNEPVAGAALMVKGTSTGTVSNPDGTYTLKAGADDVIVCQFFGYKTLEVNVANRAKVDFALEEDVETLEATVVVGYGTLKKTQLVGSVQKTILWSPQTKAAISILKQPMQKFQRSTANMMPSSLPWDPWKAQHQ